MPKPNPKASEDKPAFLVFVPWSGGTTAITGFGEAEERAAHTLAERQGGLVVRVPVVGNYTGR